uniref:Uncharacterized protein n=1 Tax=Arundo donax TaxID=35708 RepID=A0A0A9F9T4_ARUDO
MPLQPRTLAARRSRTHRDSLEPAAACARRPSKPRTRALLPPRARHPLQMSTSASLPPRDLTARHSSTPAPRRRRALTTLLREMRRIPPARSPPQTEHHLPLAAHLTAATTR